MNRKNSFDELTATYNRSAFLSLMAKFFDKNLSQGLLTMDIDDLRYISMVRSRDIGDKIVISVARNIYNNVPKNTIIGRIGEDSFGVFFPDLESSSFMNEIANRLVMLHRKPFKYNDDKFIHTISIGGAHANMLPTSSATAEKLLYYSEMALQAAKSNGKNQYIEFDKKYLISINRKKEILNLLKEAVNKKSFMVNFQPLFNMQTGEQLGFEALCRLKDNDGKNINPSEFIKIAEENNLIFDIDMFVLEYVCRLLYENNYIKNNISVNISPITLLNPGFIPNLKTILEKYYTDTSLLSLELTETSFIESFLRAKDILVKLNKMGIKVLLDDFGTGYANLISMLMLNVDTLKIDKSLVENIHELKNNFIVKKTLEIAEVFNMDVVIEGVENRLQYDLLKKMNCKIGQGFYLGKPMPVDELIPYIKNKY